MNMINRKGNKSKRSAGGRKPPNGRSVMPVKPPQIETSISFGRTFRFHCATTGTNSVARQQLLDLLVMVTSANTSFRICDAVKVRRIRVWGNPPGLAGAAVVAPVTLQWFSEYGPTRIVSDSGMGTAFGARVVSKPPPQSLAGFWSLAGTNEATVLFDIALNQGDILDVELTFRVQNQFLIATGAEAATQVNLTAAGTVGVVYCLSLDPHATAKLPPDGMKTIV